MSASSLDRMAAAEEAKYTLQYSFRGASLSLLQRPRGRDADGELNFTMPTGWCCWEASNILLRWVAHDANVASALGLAPAAPRLPWRALRVLDLSAGAGLVALAAAAAGAAAVAASDIPEQLPQLRDNVVRAGGALLRAVDDAGASVGGSASAAAPADAPPPQEPPGCAEAPTPVAVLPYFWGSPVAQLRPPSPVPAVGDLPAPPALCDARRAAWWYDLVLVSDILYIAIRDQRTRELEATLRGLTDHCGCLVMAFEERLPDEEQALMERLGLAPRGGGGAPQPPGDEQRSGVAPPPPLLVHELTGDAVRVDFEDSLQRQGAGGHADTELFNPWLFYECPPVRLFVLRRAAEPAADAAE